MIYLVKYTDQKNTVNCISDIISTYNNIDLIQLDDLFYTKYKTVLDHLGMCTSTIYRYGHYYVLIDDLFKQFSTIDIEYEKYYNDLKNHIRFNSINSIML